MRTTAKPGALVLSCFLLLGIWSCPRATDDGDEEKLRKRLERARARAESARKRARREEGRRRAADSDYTVAATVSISCVIALLLVIGLLVRERKRRKILARLLRLLRRKMTDDRGLHR